MSIGLFTDEVIDHFSNPRNVGEMEDANGIGDAGEPSCGDTMRLYIKETLINKPIELRG